MSKEIYISSTPHETRLAIVEKDELTEIYYERENEYTLAGSIYNGRVTRVLPGMQSSFVDIGLERDAFLYITDFMEEAGDAAVFEGAQTVEGAGDRGPNGGQSGSQDRNQDRNQERNQDRGGTARNGERPARDRDRGRAGRRDDRSREGQSGSGEPVAEESRNLTPAANEEFEPAPSASEGEEIGEGAPGANGSRRWRGRRGRRRGRGGNGESTAEGPSVGERVESAPAANEAAPESSADRAPREGSARNESDRSFQNRGRDAEQNRAGDAEPSRGRDAEQNRGRDAERNRERGGRQDSGRERFAPRAARGESGRPGWGAEEPSGTGPAAEPFILPGESLSKYRRAEAGADDPAANQGIGAAAAAPLKIKPSTEVEPLIGWDGGLVLPGETLSRHREPAAATANESSYSRQGQERGFSGSPNPSGTPERGRDRRRERDARRGPPGSEETTPASYEGARAQFSAAPQGLDPYEAVQPAVTSQHEPEAAALPFGEAVADFYASDSDSDVVELIATTEPDADVFPAAEGFEPAEGFESAEGSEAQIAEEVLYEPETDIAPLEAAAPEALLEVLEEFHETVAEYEPEEEASASYRVDPVAASEFRQSAPVEELANPELEGTSEAELSATAGVDLPGSGEAEPAALSHFVEPAFASAEPAAEFEEMLSGHDFTAVQDTGEMISEISFPEAATVEAAALEAFSTAPIEHEAVVQSVHLEEAQTSAVSFAPFSSEPVSGGGFSTSFEPGDGRLEEELLDDDEAELGLLPGGAFDDDTEEETLEASAGEAPDLGSMLRDLSIDQITRPEPVELDEDEDDEDFDIDEEDLEENELQSTEEYETEADGEVSGIQISETEEEEFAEFDSPNEGAEESGTDPAADVRIAGEGEVRQREGGPRGRRDGRRGGRDREDRSGAGGQRDRRGNNGNGGGRERSGRSMQPTHLPAISDLLKPGQEVLVQIAKEPMAKKGARITSHIALPGRFLVFMPTVNHVGVSRKIESDGERRRLKEILLSEKGEASGGFIVRTAASGASEEELRSDLRFLLNLWADIKQRSESSKSPALIYHDLNLVERILRDQVTDNFSAIWVDTETEYERVLRFLQRFQPSLIRRVKLYTKDTPLFEQFGISPEIDKALRSKVWLKSGGSIVINQTEALVAIDINTGKFVGKTARLEDTIVKTNLDAIPEIVRQIRLRDLGGIIIIDFIDMDERKNRNKVMAALEEELKKDRAPSKVLQFNDFGLVAITRKRVKQSLERTLSTTCAICQGTGMTKSAVTVCNDIYIEMRKMHKIIEKGDIMLRVNPEVVKQLKSGSGKWLQEMEEMSGKTILVKSDPSLHPEQFDIH